MEVALQNIASKIQKSLLILKFNMDVRRIMIIIEHPDDNSKKDGDYRHKLLSLKFI